MTCQYCGGTAPVPDVEARKKKQEVATPDPQEGYFIQEADRSKASAPGAGLMRMLIWGVILLVGVGLPLRLTGVLDNVTEPLWGSYGSGRFNKASDRIRVSKYEQAGRAHVEQYFYTVKKHYVSLKAGQCYALVMGSGQPFKAVALTDPAGAVKLAHKTLRLHDTLVHCPTSAGAFALTVALDHPGRYVWALFRKPLQEQVEPQELPPRTRRKVTRRRKSRRRKRSRKAGKAAQPAGQGASQAVSPDEPLSEPASPPGDVDDELRRALKNSEIPQGDL